MCEPVDISLEYATRVYSPYDNVAVLSWVALGNVYPVIRGDRDKLFGAGRYKNYDAY